MKSLFYSTVISTYHAFGHEDEVTDVTSSIEPPAKRGLFSDDDDTDDEMLSQYAAANAQSTVVLSVTMFRLIDNKATLIYVVRQ